MTKMIPQKLNASRAMRWTVLIAVSLTMFCGYFITDVMAPLMDLLQEEFQWTQYEYSCFSWSYGWLNVFLFMLIFSGIILDKLGVRITGVMSGGLMIIGCWLKYYAVSQTFDGEILGLRTQVFIACVGFSIFALGIETAGLTVTKAIVRWFKGYEIALAMGFQVAIARLGTALAMLTAIPLSKYFGNLSAPILFGLGALCIGLIVYLVFCVMDKKLDASAGKDENSEEPFRISDIKYIISNRGFWLIALLCVLFYSAVFPFLKYATSLMINKYHVAQELAGSIPAILPFGTILLTPLFGTIYDRRGKGATIMIIGSLMLIAVHAMLAAPLVNEWWMAAVLMVVLGVSFSLVPSAMWPSVPKIIPENRLGTAYALIFWVQNIGLSCVPLLIGYVLEKFGTSSGENGEARLDYTVPMLIFTGFGALSLIVALMLKREDRIKRYGLELPDLKKSA